MGDIRQGPGQGFLFLPGGVQLAVKGGGELVQLVFKDGVKLNWAARIVEKEFPYQEANFTVFMNKYKKYSKK